MTAREGMHHLRTLGTSIDGGNLHRMRILPLFASLSQAESNVLLQSAAVEEIPGKTLLLREGERPDFLLLLLDGLVQLTATRARLDVAIAILKPPNCFDLASILCDNASITSARTVVDSCLIRIAADCVRRLFAENADFARNAVRDLSLNYRNAIRELKSIRMQTGFQRLIAWILAMHAGSRAPSEIELPFDKGLLAARLGMKPETLSRSLSRLTDFGVTVSQRKLHIASTTKLRNYARAKQICENVLVP